MTDKTTADGKYVLCEFFGMKISTKNAEMARILTADIGEFLNQEIQFYRPKAPIEDPPPSRGLFDANFLKINVRLHKRGSTTWDPDNG